MIGIAHEVFISKIQKVWNVVAFDVVKWRGVFDDGITEPPVPREEWIKRLNEAHVGLTRPMLRSTGKPWVGRADRYLAFGIGEMLARENDAPPGIFTRMTNSIPVIIADGSVEGTTYANYRNRVEVCCIGITQTEASLLAGFALAAIVTTRTEIFAQTTIGQIGAPSYDEIRPMTELLPDHGSAYWVRLTYNLGEDVVGAPIELEKNTRTRATKVAVHDIRARSAQGHAGRVRPIVK